MPTLKLRNLPFPCSTSANGSSRILYYKTCANSLFQRICLIKLNLNSDKVPDYVFVSIKVWNGRFAGQADVGVFVSNPQKKYTFNAFETRHLEAEVINGKVMLIKYAYSDDNENLIRQLYTFNKDGRIQLYQADTLLFFKK